MRKRYWLALWGWGAIGLLHIWVLKTIEEKEILINEVSGTSMWSIIAALYAMWKTTEEMQTFAKDINYLKMIDFDLKNWLLKWNKITKKLEEMFSDQKIEDLKMKLIIIATNIETWEKKIFREWKIIDAVRSSISIPGVFIPYKIWDDSFVDGWLLNNLPIEVLDGKNIIAVSAIKDIDAPIKRRRKMLWIDLSVWFFNLNFQILQRALLLMMKSNEVASLNTKWKEINFIKCNTDWYDVYSFNKVDELVKIWYNNANNIL